MVVADTFGRLAHGVDAHPDANRHAVFSANGVMASVSLIISVGEINQAQFKVVMVAVAAMLGRLACGVNVLRPADRAAQYSVKEAMVLW